jgi:hypothetical protein
LLPAHSQRMTELAEVEAAEIVLLELALALDEPVEDRDYPCALAALGQRARTLFLGSRELHGGEAPTAARALLRPMVEINLLVRFLRKSPELHTELWHAEGARNTVTMIREHRASAILTARWGQAPIAESELEDLDRKVREARERAHKAGVSGVSQRGGVLPTAAQQLDTIRETAADEAYTFAYRIQSSDVHAGPRTVQGGVWEVRDDGTVSYRDESSAQGRLSVRLFAVTVFASTLELVASELGLPIEAAARDVRRIFVPEEIPPEQRLDALSDQPDPQH